MKKTNSNTYIIKDILKVKLSSGAQMPKYANNNTTELLLAANEQVVIGPRAVGVVNTGIAIELKTNVGMDIQLCQIEALSARNLYILNHPATIDGDYRGEIKVVLYNLSKESVNILISDIVGRLSFNMIKKIQMELYSTQK